MTSLLGCSGEDFASILNSLGYRLRRTSKIEAAAPAEAPAATEARVVETPVETAETADAADAAVNEAAVAAVEGSETSAPVEAAAVETATADLGAPAPENKPAEPQFDEVWFPAGRRPDNKRHAPRREPAEGEARPPRHQKRERDPRPRPQAPAATSATGNATGNGGTPEARQAERPRKPDHRRDKDRDEAKRERPQRDRRPVVVDPDSPWAALAALRNPKS
jgi:ATP-dependent RNA helicase SUPV3L1/SUV3